MREDWVDIAKAIAIMAIVIWHIHVCWIETPLLPLHILVAGSWPVPVFFMMAGFFLINNKLQHPKSFITRKAKTLYLPTLWLYIGAVLLHNFFFIIGFYDTNINYDGKYLHIYSVHEILKNIVLSLFMAGQELILSPMWFVCVLFVALGIMSVISWVLSIIISSNRIYLWMQSIIFFLLVTIWTVINHFHPIIIPRFSKLLPAIWLIFVGMAVRNVFNIQFNNPIIAIIAVFIVYVTTILQPLTNDLLPTNTVITIAACYALCYLSKKINKQIKYLNNILAFIGRHSFYIMALHCFGFKFFTLFISTLGIRNNLALLTPVVGNDIFLFTGYLLSGVFIPILLIRCFRITKAFLKKATLKNNRWSH